MAAFRASLHAPSSLVCSAAESDNSSEDELPFDENIPLAGYKEQDEEEDEEAIGDVESVSSQSCCIRPRIKLKVAFDTRNVFLNLWSVYVFHTSSNHPLLRGSRRHDRSAVVFSEEIRKAERKKKLLIITFARRSKGKWFSAAFLFFSSSSSVRVLKVAIYAGSYGAAHFSSPLTAVLTTVRTLN